MHRARSFLASLLLVLSSIIGCAPSPVGAATPTVYFSIQDGIGRILSNSVVSLTPGTIGINGTNFSTLDKIDLTNDASGLLYVTNMMPLRWKVEVSGPYKVTPFFVDIPDTNILVNAKDYMVITPAPSGTYPRAQSDARYEYKAGNTPGTAGQVLSTDGHGSNAWVTASSSGGANVTTTNNSGITLATNVSVVSMAVTPGVYESAGAAASVSNAMSTFVLSATNNSSIYWAQDPLPRFRAAVAGTLNGRTNATIFNLGDSTSLGFGGGLGGQSNCMSSNVTAYLAAYIPQSLPGWMGSHVYNVHTNFYFVGILDTNLVIPNNWTVISFDSVGGQLLYNTAGTTNAIVYSVRKPVSGIKIYTYGVGAGGTCDLNVIMDGSTTLATIRTGDVTGQIITNLSCASGIHTFALQATNTTSVGCYAVGMVPYTTNSITIINGGWESSRTIDWLTTTQPYSPMRMLTNINPDLVIINLGINDVLQGQTAAFSNNLYQIVTNLQGKCQSDVVLCVPNASGFDSPVIITNIYNIGNLLGCPVIDLHKHFGSAALATRWGEMYDSTHPNAIGYADIARAIASVVVPLSFNNAIVDATNNLPTVYAQRGLNAADFSDARSASSNLSVKMMSPVAGNNEIADMKASTPSFIGQLGLSYGGSSFKSAYLWAAGAIAPGNPGWESPISLYNGIAGIGSKIYMSDNAATNLHHTVWAWQGSSNAQTYASAFNANGTQIDSGLELWNMANYQSGSSLWMPFVTTNTAYGYPVVATNANNEKIYGDVYNGGSLVMVPENDPIGETNEANNFCIILGPTVGGYWSQNQTFGGFFGQYPYLGIDTRYHNDHSKPMGVWFPKWVGNVYTVTNGARATTAYFDELNGIANIGILSASNIWSTNFAYFGPFQGNAFQHSTSGFNVNTNAAFNNDESSWTFDSRNSNRGGFIKWASNFPMLAHATNTPFQIACASISDLHADHSAATLAKELYIDVDHTTYMTNGQIVVAGVTNQSLTPSTLTLSDPGKKASSLANGGANTVVHGTTPPTYSAVVEADLGLTDITTGNATSSQHGFLPKLDGNAAHVLLGTGAFGAVPGGSGSTPTFGIQFGVDAGGGFTNIAAGAAFTNETFVASDANHTPLEVVGAPSQVSALFNVKSNTTKVLIVGPDGALTANGSGVTNLNATELRSGTVADGRLSANVALLNANQAFTGINQLNGNSNYVTRLAFTGTAPTVSTNGGNGTGGSATLEFGSDSSGIITWNAGATTIGSTNYVTLTFNRPFNTKPLVMIQMVAEAGDATSTFTSTPARIFVGSVTTAKFEILGTSTAVTANATYHVQYQVFGQ